MVTGAIALDIHNRIPLPPRAMLERHPRAFADLLNSNIANMTGVQWAKAFPTEFGRALILANYDSVDALRPRDAGTEAETLATLLDYRHAETKAPAPTVIAACDCYSYQACEVSDWDSAWANKACDMLREAAIHEVTKGQPWGIPDGYRAPGAPALALVKG